MGCCSLCVWYLTTEMMVDIILHIRGGKSLLLAKKVECHNFVYIFIYKKPLFSSNCQNFPQNTKMLWKKSPSLSTSPPILHPWWCLQLVQEVTLFCCWCYECVKWLGWALYILRKKKPTHFQFITNCGYGKSSVVK